MLPPVDTQNFCSMSHASCGRTELELEQERGECEEEEQEQEQGGLEQEDAAENGKRQQQRRGPVTLGCEVKELSNGRTHTTLRPIPHSHISNPRFRSMHAREKKATQMLAIVLGEWIAVRFFLLGSIHLFETRLSVLVSTSRH